MRMPTLSVLMPNYNHGKYIGEALESILNQSHRPMEVIVLDDASTDNSLEIIQRFVKKDPIVKLVQNEKNMGVIYSANRLRNLARGDYVFGTSADDKVLPGFFEKSMNLLRKYPHAGLCCTDSANLDDATGAIIKKSMNIVHRPQYFSSRVMAELSRKTPFYISYHTSIMKRDALLEVGGFIPELEWHGDWLAWCTIAFRYGICYIPEALASIRMLPSSYSSSGARQWPVQYKILNRMLILLKDPEYKDILPLLRYSCVLDNSVLPGILRIILTTPKHWSFLSLSLIKKALRDNILTILSPNVPSRIRKSYQRLRTRKIRRHVYEIVEKDGLP